MIKESIMKIVSGENLTEREAIGTMNEIMDGEATDAQIAAFIVGLRMKGETVSEITGCAKAMRDHAIRINARANRVVDIDREEINIDEETIVDTCGTGGDGTNTFNISTATAFVVAGAGLTVAKHGNRAVSSSTGSADVLEALGVNLDVTPEKVEECISKIGIGFLYAPLLHSAMKYAIGPRRQIGIRTIFNILGPLTNPARANVQILGVYSQELTEVMARVLGNLGCRRAFVVHGMDSLDEISITGETRVSELTAEGEVRTYSVTPEDFGLKRSSSADIRGGDAKGNAAIIESILKGERGPRRDIVLANAAAAIVAGGKAKDLREGVRVAEESIDSGRALKKLEALKAMTNG
ncbi:MAG: anthranilate phosphoribosyltransferase [bacterium]